MTADELHRLVDRIASDLGEHFDAVQILVSWNENGLTKCKHLGCGNWYARQGMAHEFINADIAQEAAQQIARVMPKSEPPEGDEWKAEK